MATLNAGLTVLSGLNSTKVIGLTAASSETTVVVTKDRAVDIYKVGNIKALSSWSAKSSSQFSCPVIFNSWSKQFVGVYNQKSLVRWNHETADLLRVKTFDVGGAISAVLDSDEEPFVVFRNGWVEALSSVISSRKKQRSNKLQKNARILNQWVTSDQRVVLLTASSREYSVVVIAPSVKGGEVLGRFSLSQPTNQQCDICDSCLALHGDVSSLFIIWSDGSVMVFKYDVTSITDSGTSSLVGQKVLQLVPGQDMTKVRIASIKNNFLAISGVHQPHGSETPEDCPHLTIWNTTYGTVHASVPQTGPHHSGTEGSGHLLVHLHDHLFVASPSALTCHSYQCESISLAQALGKLSVNEPTTTTERWITEQTESAVSSASIEAAKDRVLDALLHPEKVYSKYKKDVQHLQTQSPSSVLEILKAISDKYSQRKDPLPRKLLQPLMKPSRVAGSACPEFLSLVLDKSDIDAALLCTESMQDLPEPFLARCLQLFLSLECGNDDDGPPAVNGGSEAEIAEKHCPVTPKQAMFINKVLVCPFNTIFLLAGIKKLKFSSVMLFLRYLDYLLSTGSFNEDDRLSEETLVDWVSVTLDAHFTQLVLTPAAKDVLTSLQKCVHQHAELYTEVKAVQRIVDAMKAAAAQTKSTKNTNESEGSYSIEILELPV